MIGGGAPEALERARPVLDVIGRPDRVHGEEVVAFVSLHSDGSVTPEELIAWAREHIGECGTRYGDHSCERRSAPFSEDLS